MIQTPQFAKKRIKAEEMYAQGISAKDIADVLGIHFTTVYDWLKKDSIPVGEGRRKYSIQLVDQIADMYKTKTRYEIADELGISVPNVQYILKAYWITKDNAVY